MGIVQWDNVNAIALRNFPRHVEHVLHDHAVTCHHRYKDPECRAVYEEDNVPVWIEVMSILSIADIIDRNCI